MPQRPIALPDDSLNPGPQKNADLVGKSADGLSDVVEERVRIDSLKETNELLYWLLSEMRFANGESRLPGNFPF